jgi:hypothetical protein
MKIISNKEKIYTSNDKLEVSGFSGLVEDLQIQQEIEVVN